MNEADLSQETPPEILAAIETAEMEAAAFDHSAYAATQFPVATVPDCIICGDRPAVSRTGRCGKCKHKRLPNNGAKVRAAVETLGIRVPPKAITSEPGIVATLQSELSELRHMLSARQALPLSDFRERVAICEAAGIETYEDGAIKLVFNNELRKALVRSLPLVTPRECEI